MAEFKIKLSKEDYEIVKNIDWSEIKNEVFFNDETKEFRTTSDIANIIFNEYIIAYGLDENYYPTEFARKLYDLYDLIFLSEEIED